MFSIRFISTADTLPLRSTVLRSNLPLEQCITPFDDLPTTFHLGLYIPTSDTNIQCTAISNSEGQELQCSGKQPDMGSSLQDSIKEKTPQQQLQQKIPQESKILMSQEENQSKILTSQQEENPQRQSEVLVCILTCMIESHPKINSPNAYRLRGMATHPDYRRKGYAKVLLEHAMEFIFNEKKINAMWFNARVIAFPFYTSLGFEFMSDEFDMPGIGPHREMFKMLGE